MALARVEDPHGSGEREEMKWWRCRLPAGQVVWLSTPEEGRQEGREEGR
jgi:hypothetical protein